LSFGLDFWWLCLFYLDVLQRGLALAVPGTAATSATLLGWWAWRHVRGLPLSW
jgi:hypothetical protein